MNPFIELPKTADVNGDKYLLNTRHIVKVDRAPGQGCKILTTDGEFYCSESFESVSAKIKLAFTS